MLHLNYSNSREGTVVSLLLLLMVFSSNGWGQTIPNSNHIIGPSPNAASMARYIDAPVDMFTGTPSINIPVCAVGGRKLKVPISLGYQASGRKVNEIASWVGYGWTLNAGGVITRAVRGLPDEKPNAFLDFADSIPNANDSIPLETKEKLVDAEYDMLPDLFYFNAGPVMGKFMFGNDGLPHLIPQGDTKIIADIKGWESSNSFKIITPDGTQYLFDSQSAETSDVEIQESDTTDVGPYTSTWYLSKIVSFDYTDTIKFIYDTSHSFEIPSITNTTVYQYSDAPENSLIKIKYNELEFETETIQHAIVNLNLLSAIEYAGGKVEFNISESNSTYGYQLDDIAVFDYDEILNNYVENSRFSFTYDTFPSTQRPRLVSAGEEGLPRYQFEYSTTALPSGSFNAKDHWGFYNGSTSTDPLAPDRESNAQYMDVYMLKKITNPLEGETEYVYEPNEYYENGNNILAGGLRIAQVINTDPFSNINDITSYEYTYPNGTASSGVLLSPYEDDHDMVVREHLMGSDYYFDCHIHTITYHGFGATSGSPVGYRYVTKYKGNSKNVAGYSLYEYDVTKDNGSAEYPFVPFGDRSWMRGKLLSVSHIST